MAFFGMKLGPVDIAVLDCSNKFPMIVGRCDGDRAVICCQGKAVQEVEFMGIQLVEQFIL